MDGAVMAPGSIPGDRVNGSKPIVGTPQPGPNTGRGNASGCIRRGSPPAFWSGIRPRGSKTGRCSVADRLLAVAGAMLRRPLFDPDHAIAG